MLPKNKVWTCKLSKTGIYFKHSDAKYYFIPLFVLFFFPLYILHILYFDPFPCRTWEQKGPTAKLKASSRILNIDCLLGWVYWKKFIV